MSKENSATQPRNLSFSIENILREDFPPKSRLAFPPKEFLRAASTPKERYASPSVIRWVPSARYTAFWPLYYRQCMYLPAYRVMPVASTKDDNGKQENKKPCLDCKNSKSVEDDTIDLSHSPGQDENHVHEQVETKTTHNSTEEERPSEVKESQSRKRRSRSQFTPMQLKYLEKYYSNHSYLSRDERTVLAQALDMTELQIRNWFQNKRYHKKVKMQSTNE